MVRGAGFTVQGVGFGVWGLGWEGGGGGHAARLRGGCALGSERRSGL